MRVWQVKLNGVPQFTYQLMTKSTRSEIFNLKQIGKVSLSSFPEELEP